MEDVTPTLPLKYKLRLNPFTAQCSIFYSARIFNFPESFAKNQWALMLTILGTIDLNALHLISIL